MLQEHIGATELQEHLWRRFSVETVTLKTALKLSELLDDKLSDELIKNIWSVEPRYRIVAKAYLNSGTPKVVALKQMIAKMKIDSSLPNRYGILAEQYINEGYSPVTAYCRAVAQKEVDNMFFTGDSDLDNLAIKNIGTLNPIELLYKFLVVKFVKQLPLLESRKIKDVSMLENITDKNIKDAGLWDNFLKFVNNYFS